MAKKAQISFVCQECGYDSPQWMGKCPECGTWNSMKEIRLAPASKNSAVMPGSLSLVQPTSTPQSLKDIKITNANRQATGFSELDTVLGGGLVLGSATLLAGDPGIGKSTLLLQLCMQVASLGMSVLYISGEESVDQIKLRADRIEKPKGKEAVVAENLLLYALTDVDQAVVQVETLKPSLVIIDSVQTMESQNAGGLAGSVGQIRYSAMHAIRVAKQLAIPLILVGHVTKEGMVAGPMVLSHMVDTVLFLEGEKFTKTKILRSLKNRFGPVDEVGIFQMEETGMHEVLNLEQLFVSDVAENVPGSVRVVTLEGSRAFLVELQALAVYSKLAMPRRVVSGLDARRVELLLAVLQKHCKLPVEQMDIFVNVAGGLKLADPGIDLGICLAIAGSIKNVSYTDTVGIAEVGLLGELRTVSNLEKRVKEAQKLGFKRIVSVTTHKKLVDVIGKSVKESHGA